MLRTRVVSLRLFAVLALALAAIGPARAEQIVEATATMFPGPDPLEWSNQVTAGDLDGDGDLDLVFANGGNFSSPGSDQPVRVYLYASLLGQFQDMTLSATGGHAGIYRGVELGDCDGDGDLDMLLAQDFDRLPQLLINDGSAHFTAEGATRLPAIALSSSRGQFGDVDNDGDLDIFLPSGTTNRFGCGQYRLYRNNGACQYTDVTLTQFPIGSVCENMDAIFGDIDNDFDLDIRTAGTGTNNSRLYRNDGSGVYSLVGLVPPDSTCYSYDFGDIDGDGDLDLLGANGLSGSSSEILLKNSGNGTFSNSSSQISPNPSQDDNDSKFFDYDNDADLDLIIARLGSGGEKLYRNDGNGNFTLTSGVIEVISDSSLDLVVGDFDGNGTYDVVTAQGESGNYTNRIYRNNGPADTLAPRIIDTEQLPDTADATGPYPVRALILDDMTSDRNFFDKGVVLGFSVNGGADQGVPMRHSGGQVYRGEIPGQAGGSTVEYWVSATDFNDNQGIGSTGSFEVENGPGGSGTISNSLTLSRNEAEEVALEWAGSCEPSDDDYAVYRGEIGSYGDPDILVCGTGGATSATDAPTGPSYYYLVVPRSAGREGSYGVDGDGEERPPASTSCAPQQIGDCG